MAFRGGRGRGRGRGGMGGGFAKQEPFILFPEDVELPDVKRVPIEEGLIKMNERLKRFWMASPYYLEETTLEETTTTKMEDCEIERYSDRSKPKSGAKRDELWIHLKHASFPSELYDGSKRMQLGQRKVRWNPESGLHKLDVLEKLEEKYGDEKPKKEGENEEEDEGVELEEEEFSSDGDYNKNEDFDDDEDEYNMMDDGNDDEGTYH